MRTWVATLAILILTGWAAGSGRWLPRPLPVAAPDTAFSSGRALAQLVEISQQPRPTGSPEHERVRTLLIGRLRSLGLEPEVQTTVSFVRDSGAVEAATVRNVMARVPGSASTGALLLNAHYDSAPLSPGASDDALGVASVLEAVRAILAGGPLRNDVLVLLTDGDELGFLGARAFAERHPWMSDVAAVLSLEARGPAGAAIPFETGSSNGRIVEILSAATAGVATSSLTRIVRGSVVESAGADAFLARGARGVAIASTAGAALRHQPGDVRARVDERTLQHGGVQLLALARALGNADLRTDLAASDRVYASLPGMGLVHHRAVWVPLVGLALLGLWGLAGAIVRSRRGTRRGVLIGVGVGLAAVAASAWLGGVLLDLVDARHVEFGFLETAFYRDGPHVLALAGLALACASLAWAVARRWARTDELLLGALMLPVGLASWLALAEPFGAPAVQWPLGVALLGALVVTALGPRQAGTSWAWAFLIVLAAAIVALATPTVELLASAWTFSQATRVGAVLGLGLLLLMPVMDWLVRPRGWWTPLVGVAAAGALVALALPRPGPGHPTPTTLLYLTEEPLESGRPALPGVAPDTSSMRWMRGNWLTVPGPGEAWARSWVGDPPVGSTDAGVLLLGADSVYEVAGTGPDARLYPPRVDVTSSTVDGDRRRVALALRSGLAGEVIGIHIPPGVDAELAGVGDLAWERGPVPVRSLTHWGLADGDHLLVSVATSPAATGLDLVVIEHHLRPREVLGGDFFGRPDSLVANAALSSDRVIQRTRVRLTLAARPSGEAGTVPSS